MPRILDDQQLSNIIHLLPQLVPDLNAPEAVGDGSPGLPLWTAIHSGCLIAMNAISSDLYLSSPDGTLLEGVETIVRHGQHLDRTSLKRLVDVGDADLAARAARAADYVEQVVPHNRKQIAVPIRTPGGSEKEQILLAVFVFQFDEVDAAEQTFVHTLLGLHVLDHLWPLTTFATIRYRSPQLDTRPIHQQRLEDVIRDALHMFCHELGFQFATISLVDLHKKEIRTIDWETRDASKINPGAWADRAHHSLRSTDIQASVLRSGRAEVIHGWDRRLDSKIFNEHAHDRLVRVFVPLGKGKNGLRLRVWWTFRGGKSARLI